MNLLRVYRQLLVRVIAGFALLSLAATVHADSVSISFESDESPSAIVGANAANLYTELGVRFSTELYGRFGNSPTIERRHSIFSVTGQVLRSGSVIGGPPPLSSRIECQDIVAEFSVPMDVRVVHLDVHNRHLRSYAVRAYTSDYDLVDEEIFFPDGRREIREYKSVVLQSDDTEAGIAIIKVQPPSDCFDLAVIDNLSYETANPIVPIEPFGSLHGVYQATDLNPNIKWSGRVNDVSINPANPNEVFVTTESGGLWKSSRGGTKGSWRAVTSLPVFTLHSVQHLTENPDVLVVTAEHDFQIITVDDTGFVTSGGGIWISRDGGDSWTQPPNAIPAHGGRRPPSSDEWCPGNSDAYGISQDPDTNRVFISTSCGVSFSDDLADIVNPEWFHRFLPFSNSNYLTRRVRAVAALIGGSVIAGGDDGAWRSTDNGNTWLRSRSNPSYDIHGATAIPGMSNTGLMISEAAPRVLSITRDGGATWQTITGTPIGRANAGGIAHIYASARSATGDRGVQLYFGEALGTNTGRLIFSATGIANVGAWTKLIGSHADTRAMAFGNLDSGTSNMEPKFLASDGGLDIMADDGSWKPIGSGSGGINALQFYGVTGQRVLPDENYRLAFGTQDNDLWSSDDGINWLETRKVGPEGNAISMSRETTSSSSTERWTYYNIGASGGNIQLSEPFFQGPVPWPGYVSQGPGWSFGSPQRVSASGLPGWYVHYMNPNAMLRAAGQQQQLALTPDFGNTVIQLDTPSPFSSNGVPMVLGSTIYQALTVGQFTDIFQEVPTQFRDVQLRRNTLSLFRTILPLFPAMNGFGSLGHYSFQFQWWPVYAASPMDTSYLIAPDVENKEILMSTNAGEDWTPIPGLKEKITRDGTFKMVKPWIAGDFVQSLVSAISFYPENPDFVILGMQMGGAYISNDRGLTWSYVENSDQIPNIVDFDWKTDRDIYVASYGKGLWRIQATGSGRRIPTSLLLDHMLQDSDIPILRNLVIRKLAVAAGYWHSVPDVSQNSQGVELVGLEEALSNNSVDSVVLLADGEIKDFHFEDDFEKSLVTTPGSILYEFGTGANVLQSDAEYMENSSLSFTRVVSDHVQQFQDRWSNNLVPPDIPDLREELNPAIEAMGIDVEKLREHLDAQRQEMIKRAGNMDIAVVGLALKSEQIVGPILGLRVYHRPSPLNSRLEEPHVNTASDVGINHPILRLYTNMDGVFLGDHIVDIDKNVSLDGYAFSPGSTLTLLVDGTKIVEVLVNDNGYFNIELSLDELSLGAHVLEAKFDNSQVESLARVVFFARHAD